MSRRSGKAITIPLLSLSLAFVPVACSGSDGAAGPQGPPGPPGAQAINASTTPPSLLAELDLVSEVVSVTVASPPVVVFRLETVGGVPIVGLVPFWESDHRFVRFTFSKLVPGQEFTTTGGRDPDSWVNYIRGTTGTPTYDSGASLQDNEDGTYTFTFNTDVTAVAGVTYDPTLTHRVAGQIGNRNTVPLEEQNLWHDFVPDGSTVTRTRYIAMTTSCNECHDKLVIHGRRFEVNYCVTCHNPDLAQGEGNFAFMIHRIHSAGTFTVIPNEFEEVTFPQDLRDCRKCHNGDDPATTEADNWWNLPNMAACGGCHSDAFGAGGTHNPAQTSNQNCVLCHGPNESEAVKKVHTNPNPTPNNPELRPGQYNISYELMDAAVDAGTGEITVNFKILDESTNPPTPLDASSLATLPADLKNPTTGFLFNTPALLLAWALPQDGVTEMVDYNNLGRASAQPFSLSLGQTSATQTGFGQYGTLTFDAGTGITTATVTNAAFQYPAGAMLRAVVLQGYFSQDLDGSGTIVEGIDAPLHTISVWVPVTGDAVRRKVVDANKCSQCHEFFEGHGGNRVFSFGSEVVCVVCHNPNLSSSGREQLNFFNAPEDAQNFKDMIHGIHSSAFRTRDFEHVRNRLGGLYYNWTSNTIPSTVPPGTPNSGDPVTFPANVKNCSLCHIDGTNELPLREGVLATTVRTTGVANGQDANPAAVTAARAGGALPNATDWVNTPTASSCFYCHTQTYTWAHMLQMGAQLSLPDVNEQSYANRSLLGQGNFEACAVCHGPGSIADVKVVHSR